METLQQMFMTVIAAFVFVILIAKITSSASNGGTDHRRNKITRDALEEDFSKSSKNDKSVSKRKSNKKVRFAIDHVDHDEFVVNRIVAEASEAKSIVFEKNCSENDHDINSVKNDETKEVICEENVGKCDEEKMCMRLLCDDGIDEAEKEKEGLISDEDDSDDDDWEGIERTDLEKVFAMAAEYGKLDDKLLQSLGNDVQMQLYALYKVATEGPCREAQPMALKVSARAKWNSWQKLGDMTPDVAMEKYIALLSELVPGWTQGIHSFVSVYVFSLHMCFWKGWINIDWLLSVIPPTGANLHGSACPKAKLVMLVKLRILLLQQWRLIYEIYGIILRCSSMVCSTVRLWFDYLCIGM
ncbi:hypothetical protein M8C21_018987 [Ambrosia artemisiifolia]|uniref:ACB domain-containing protein n=1 Tax=Ambrosia artemisiifolia TaxID=4212 RepID=A0AAD5GS43_AMBAR|nr:hypothetical protein M8C21_018987 [Ambrosia artemisiifolia]